MSFKRQTHCHKGHEFAGANVGIQSTGNGEQRYCRQCKREANQRCRQRRRKLESRPDDRDAFRWPKGAVSVSVAGWGVRV